MTEYLAIRLPENAGQPADWIVVDSMGGRLGEPRSGSVEDAAADARDRKVLVLAPSTEVLTTTVTLPIKSTSRILAALPYALEEFLAEDVEELHFAAGERHASGQIPVSVVNRATLTGWLEMLREAGLQPQAIVAETYGLALVPGAASMLVTNGRVYVNDGADTALVLQDVSPSDALAAIGLSAETADETSTEAAGPRHVLVYGDPGVEEKYAGDWLELRQDFETVDIKVLPDGPLPRLAATVAAGGGVNLLQGEFGRKTEYAALLKPWRSAAVLFVALGATLFGAKLIDFWQLRNQEVELRERFLAEYREIAPAAADVPDPAAVIASLRSRTGGSDAPAVFLESLQHLARALSQNREASIQAISYRAGVIDVRLSAPSVSTLDNIRRLVDESGTFQARIQSTDQEGETVNSRIQIQATGA